MYSNVVSMKWSQKSIEKDLLKTELISVEFFVKKARTNIKFTRKLAKVEEKS